MDNLSKILFYHPSGIMGVIFTKGKDKTVMEQGQTIFHKMGYQRCHLSRYPMIFQNVKKMTKNPRQKQVVFNTDKPQ